MSRYIPKRNRGSVFPKGRKLYTKFNYHKHTVEYATGDLDTPENRDQWEEWLDNAIEAIDSGTFVYAEVFPGAKPEKIAFFSRLEGNEPEVDPRLISLGDVIKKYQLEIVPNITAKSTRESYDSKIRCRILPYFENMTFNQLNSTEVAKFIGKLAGTNKKRS
jgi:hypothetical protein